MSSVVAVSVDWPFLSASRWSIGTFVSQRAVGLLGPHPSSNLKSSSIRTGILSRRRAGQTVGGGYSPRGGPSVGSARMWAMPDTRPSAPIPSVYQLRVVVRGVSPLIWRRLLVPADTTIAGLHAVLQVAFGWTGTHL